MSNATKTAKVSPMRQLVMDHAKKLREMTDAELNQFLLSNDLYRENRAHHFWRFTQELVPELKQPKFLVQRQLVERGWSKRGIIEVLGEPDRVERNPYYKTGPHPMKLYLLSRVESLETNNTTWNIHG